MAKARYKKIQAGCLVREIVYTPVHIGVTAPKERQARQRVTTAARRKINLKKSSEQLCYLLAANFGARDTMYTLTFDDAHLPPDRVEARKIIKKLLAQLRQHFRSHDCELKYIYAMEGKHGSRRLHFHLVANLRDLALMEQLWVYGHVHEDALDVRQLPELARYLTKEAREDGARVGAHSWSGSRNLAKPTVEPAQWVPDTCKPTPPAEAYILERVEQVNEYGHFYYVEYFLTDNFIVEKSAGSCV